MTQYVMEASGIKRTEIIEETDTFGDSAVERTVVGLVDHDPVTLGGIYDDTATNGPDVIFNRRGASGTLKYTWGGTKTTTIEAIIESYERKPTRKQLHKYTVTLNPTGDSTEV